MPGVTAFIFYLAALGAILSGSMLLPALVAFGLDESAVAYRLLMYAVLGGFLSSSILLSILGRARGLSRNDAILLAITSWVFFPVLMVIPISDLAGLTTVDAFFQALSSFTTTGALIVQNPDTLPKSVLFLLAQNQWLGGMATLITLVLVLAPWEIGGLPQVASASVAASIVSSHDRLMAFCWKIFRAYLAFTLICMIILLIVGVPAYDAIILSYTALSTGGILPPGDAIDLLLGPIGMITMAVFLFIGASSIFWHQDLFRFEFQKLRSHRESYFLAAVILVLAGFITYSLLRASGATPGSSGGYTLAEGLLNASSLVSTSAIQSRPGVFSLLPPTLVLLLVFVGGGCYSTAGGVKFFRIGGMFTLAKHELDKLVYPNSVRPNKFGNTRYDLEFMKAVWSLFSVIIVTLGFGCFLLAMNGLSFQPAFTASVAALTNAGPLYGEFWGIANTAEWPSYFEMSANQKIILATLMLLGRLEVIAVFAALTVLLKGFR